MRIFIYPNGLYPREGGSRKVVRLALKDWRELFAPDEALLFCKLLARRFPPDKPASSGLLLATLDRGATPISAPNRLRLSELLADIEDPYPLINRRSELTLRLAVSILPVSPYALKPSTDLLKEPDNLIIISRVICGFLFASIYPPLVI